MQEEKPQEIQPCISKLENQTFTQFPAVWSELRSKQQFSDVTIRCNDSRVFPVHRTILSAVSPYFKKLFTYCPDAMVKASSDGAEEPVFVLNEVPADIFGLILDYAYTGTCQINAGNVERLLPLAHCFQIDDIVNLCCRFLISELTPGNCLGICRLAHYYLGSEIEKQMHQFICQNFKAIVDDGVEFKRLTVDELEQILRDDELDCRGEERIFESIKIWVEASKTDRRAHLPRLLGCVRFGLMKSRYFHSNVFPWCLEQNLKECSEILLTIANQLGKRPSVQGSIHWMNHSKDNSYWPRMSHEFLFTIGGYCEHLVNCVETYDFKTNTWVMRVDIEFKSLAYHGICELDNQIYVIGGYAGENKMSALTYSFNPLTKKWRNRSSMFEARCFVSVCVNGGKIYALGGKNESQRLNTCERYDPTENSWEVIAPMKKRRSDASAAALGGRVYVAGGFDGEKIHDSCEVYDPASDQWSLIPPMAERRSGNSLVAYRDCLYVLGGFDGRSRLCTAEMFDPTEPEKWQPIFHMETPRSNFAAAVLDDMIFVIGGYSGSMPIATVECYEADSNRWYFAAPMGCRRSALSACVVGGLGYHREYCSQHKQVKS